MAIYYALCNRGKVGFDIDTGQLEIYENKKYAELSQHDHQEIVEIEVKRVEPKGERSFIRKALS